jgi:glucan 1,3-beta-glucosidase
VEGAYPRESPLCTRAKHARLRVQIGNSNASTVEAPLWSYQLGLENGWMPPDPRASVGKCAALVSGQSTTSLTTYTYAASQTGGPAAPSAQPPSLAQSFPWPPTTLSSLPPGLLYPALAPTYTPTGAVSTLPMPSVTKGVSEGDGWARAADAGGAYTPVAGCSYANAWDSVSAVAPTAACGAGATQRRRWVEARATPRAR